MIKYFRKIRQRLVIGNKFGRYLIYAMGEIVLVVIGILIALSINNWNERQKLLLLQKDLLSEVKSGLEDDLAQLNDCISDHQKFLNSQKIILDWLLTKSSYVDSLSTHFLYSIFHTPFTSNDGPFETLKQNGMAKIENAMLRNQISNLYDVRYEYLYWHQNDYAKLKADFRQLMSDNRFQQVEAPNRYQRGFKPIANLRIDNQFLFQLTLLNDNNNIFTNRRMINTKTLIEETIQMIEKEIEGSI